MLKFKISVQVNKTRALISVLYPTYFKSACINQSSIDTLKIRNYFFYMRVGDGGGVYVEGGGRVRVYLVCQIKPEGYLKPPLQLLHKWQR